MGGLIIPTQSKRREKVWGKGRKEQAVFGFNIIMNNKILAAYIFPGATNGL